MSGNPVCPSTPPCRTVTIGLTYDLRDDYLREGYSLEETAELDKPDTIEAIENVLKKNGHATDRIGHVLSLIHISEPTRPHSTSYAVFCLKKKIPSSHRSPPRRT